ncbi:hypothetical protein BC938DRAFT_479192 [Jimgerdemannia flammicorona]|uniref:Uncharacterized protein n=1 Tax=Jimgerdemannia flammicorona TaxID=994334 RepID=A0A433QXY3_9FUNG|nr:hypothetical protein BC938DRAFT_479192 [Jimgerdemannia flammicorona]
MTPIWRLFSKISIFGINPRDLFRITFPEIIFLFIVHVTWPRGHGGNLLNYLVYYCLLTETCTKLMFNSPSKLTTRIGIQLEMNN